MESVSEIFGADCHHTYINLNWAGRVERPAAIAARLSATMMMLSDRTGLQWYHDTEDLGSRTANFELVPTAEEQLARVIDSSATREGGDIFSWTGFFLLLCASSDSGPDPEVPSMAFLSGSTASNMEVRNQIKLQLADDFPLGSPSHAARWFLDLVRLWQPDQARLSTSALQKATGLTRAAYLSWTSAKAYAEPENDAEIRVPFGDGNLRAARVWTVESVAALDRELGQAGAPRFRQRPPEQVPPRFPDGYPDGLEALDTEVAWVRQDSAAQ